jgi:hypothetical protein
MPTSNTQTVLDIMRASIIDRKTARATSAGLTPVGAELSRSDAAPAMGLGGRHKAAFPYDDPQTIHDALHRGLNLVADIREELDHVGRGIIALSALYGLTGQAPVPQPQPEASAKQLEFEADLRAKSVAAQTQAFRGAIGTWECPKHPGPAVPMVGKRTGRKYLACAVADCGQFEKEVAK